MDYWKKADIYLDKVMEYYREIGKSKNPSKELTELYSFVKEIIPEFYANERMHPSYQFLRERILWCEELLPNKFIVDSIPNFNIKDDKKIGSCFDSKSILDYLVYQTRKCLVLEYSMNINRPLDIRNLSFENDCIIASKKVKELCDELNIESYIVTISPGYEENANLFNGNGFHLFNLVKLDKWYLVDCTYRQFFTLRQNYLERIGIVDLAGCKVGTFMLMTEDRKQIANRILSEGWIELDGDILKNYLDGFTLSFRNGLYYEKTGDFSYTTEYSIYDYKNFLIGEDNQIYHEGKEVLGYQKKPLRSSNIFF